MNTLLVLFACRHPAAVPQSAEDIPDVPDVGISAPDAVAPTIAAPRPTFVPPPTDDPEAWQVALYCDAVAQAPSLTPSARAEWIATELSKALAALGQDPDDSLFTRLAGMTPEARSAHFRELVDTWQLHDRCTQALEELTP